MNYNELYEILKENFEKEGNFKTIEDLNCNDRNHSFSF